MFSRLKILHQTIFDTLGLAVGSALLPHAAVPTWKICVVGRGFSLGDPYYRAGCAASVAATGASRDRSRDARLPTRMLLDISSDPIVFERQTHTLPDKVDSLLLLRPSFTD